MTAYTASISRVDSNADGVGLQMIEWVCAGLDYGYSAGD